MTNLGARDGSETPQLYVGFRGSAVDRPVRMLVDFRRVYLAAGESKTVRLTARRDDLAYYDAQKACFVREDIDFDAYIGTDERAAALTAIPFRFAPERAK